MEESMLGKIKKWIWIPIVLIVLVVAILGIRLYQSNQANAALQGLETQTVKRGSLTASVGATGTIQARQQATLSFSITGRVGTVNVKTGDAVTAKQVLVTMDPAYYPQQVISAQIDQVNAQKALDDLLRSHTSLAQALVDLKAMQKSLDDYTDTYNRLAKNYFAEDMDTAKKDLQTNQAYYEYLRSHNDGTFRAQFQIEQAYITYIKSLQLYQDTYANYEWAGRKGMTALQSDIDKAKADMDLAMAKRDDALAAYDRQKGGVPAADLAAAQSRLEAANAVLRQTQITAPFDGTVLAVEVTPGDLVNAGTVAFVIADLHELHVDVPVAEVDYTRVQFGQNAALTLDAIQGKTYHGAVVEIGLTATTSQSAVSYPIKVILTDADTHVLPGMTAAVDIEVTRIDNVLLVPNRAVRSSDGSRIIYVEKDGMLTPVTVTLGSGNDTESEVIKGLAEGDVIVLNPPTSFFSMGGPPQSMRMGNGGGASRTNSTQAQ
jgi:HlyD family secretion protein